MTLWQEFEEYLWAVDAGGGKRCFRQADVAATLGVSGSEATQMIQAYQAAQLSPACNTLFVIKRTGRTSKAVWHVGHNLGDLRKLLAQYADDTQARIADHLVPMMDLISEKGNASVKKKATEKVLDIGRLIQQLADLAS